MNEALKNTLEDAKCHLEEMNECGDLEERMEASQRVAALELLLAEKERQCVEAQFVECGLCRGTGRQHDYDYEWSCSCCSGLGGSYS